MLPDVLLARPQLAASPVTQPAEQKSIPNFLSATQARILEIINKTGLSLSIEALAEAVYQRKPTRSRVEALLSALNELPDAFAEKGMKVIYDSKERRINVISSGSSQNGQVEDNSGSPVNKSLGPKSYENGQPKPMYTNNHREMTEAERRRIIDTLALDLAFTVSGYMVNFPAGKRDPVIGNLSRDVLDLLPITGFSETDVALAFGQTDVGKKQRLLIAEIINKLQSVWFERKMPNVQGKEYQLWRNCRTLIERTLPFPGAVRVICHHFRVPMQEYLQPSRQQVNKPAYIP